MSDDRRKLIQEAAEQRRRAQEAAEYRAKAKRQEELERQRQADQARAQQRIEEIHRQRQLELERLRIAAEAKLKVLEDTTVKQPIQGQSFWFLYDGTIPADIENLMATKVKATPAVYHGWELAFTDRGISLQRHNRRRVFGWAAVFPSEDRPFMKEYFKRNYYADECVIDRIELPLFEVSRPKSDALWTPGTKLRHYERVHKKAALTIPYFQPVRQSKANHGSSIRGDIDSAQMRFPTDEDVWRLSQMLDMFWS